MVGYLCQTKADTKFKNQILIGKKKKRVVFMPCADTTHNIYYAGHLLRVRSPVSLPQLYPNRTHR